MNPNDETIYGGMPAENEKSAQVTNEQVNKNEVPWKFIGLGAATGILMGAGALYAGEALASENPETQGLQPIGPATAEDVNQTKPVANNDLPLAKVSSGDSFANAFAEARAQVGPGGVFHWHGGIYNTYTKEEWDALSDSDKKAFAAKIQPEYGVERIKTTDITEEHPQIHIDNVEFNEYKYNYTTVVNDSQQEDKDDDVHVIGYMGTDEVTVNGKDISVDNYVIDGHNAAVVNFHDEDVHNIIWEDKNNNLTIDHAESKDLVTNEVLDSNWNPINDTDNLLTEANDAGASDPTPVN